MGGPQLRMSILRIEDVVLGVPCDALHKEL